MAARGEIARCFVALDVDEACVRATERAQHLLDALDVRKAPVSEGVHLTIKFIGDVDIDAVGRPLLEAMRPLVEGHRTPSLGEGKLAAFPDARRAHVLILMAADAMGALAALAARADEAAEGLGLAREQRPFRPHLTLARSKHGIDVRELVKKTPPFELGVGTRLVLYRSDRDEKGSHYTALAQAEFAP